MKKWDRAEIERKSSGSKYEVSKMSLSLHSREQAPAGYMVRGDIESVCTDIRVSYVLPYNVYNIFARHKSYIQFN
jgi:hypothetical protein